jgi:alcohol dehydrogenase (cytochrome c)
MVFSFRTNAPGSLASSPQQAGGLLFLLTPFPHTLFALDPSRPDDPVRWRYAPQPDSLAQGLACCERMNNGPILANGRLYLTTLDGHVVALDETSGAVAWDIRPASPARGETLTGAPLVAEGKVFIGNSGDEYGARGWIAALGESSGQELWRKYSTGPDSDVGIDAGFKPRYEKDRGKDLGVATWPPDAWRRGGGGVSGPLLYDPSAKVVFHGTGRPAPWNPDQRTGDDKWTSGLFARDADTGAARWYDALNPHDLFALGGNGPDLSVDAKWRGADRRMLLHLDANGYLYLIDRASGEMLDVQAFAAPNATSGVDLKTGALRRDPAKSTRAETTIRDVCPGWPGAVNGEAALSVEAEIVYIPVTRLCMDIEATNTTFIQGAAYIGAYLREKPRADRQGGAVLAWDFAAGKAAWTALERFPVVGGVLATESGLLFYGTLDGVFKALDARSGRLLWSFNTASGIVSRPISYLGPDGRQYVAVVAGLGDNFDVSAAHGVDVRDATAAHGLANALRDLPPPSDPSGVLYVFALP